MERINAIEYWYPKIKDIVPTPKTIIIPIMWNWDKTSNFLEVPKRFLDRIEKQSKQFKFPIFVRGSDSSIKHNWKETCFVASEKYLKSQVVHIVNETMCLDMMSSIPCSSIALREYIPMDSKFTAFWGSMPVNPERRYFINKGQILCRHTYWFEEAIRNPSVKNWKELLKEMNTETKEEIALLTFCTNEIGKIFKGYWSVDFCRTKNGLWYCIDMAVGEQSWHPECKFNLTHKKRRKNP
jgi:hypothetical protein